MQMPPTSDGIRTVGCNLARLVPDAGHLDAIRHAVASTHKATILATELLNMHVRRLLLEEGADLAVLFSASWLLNAYNEVTTGKRKVKIVPELRPWEQKEAEMGKKIRGLRRCTQRDCMLPLNRDRNGATNIGTSGCCKERCRFAP